MHAVKGRSMPLIEGFRDGPVGGQHRLFDESMGRVSLPEKRIEGSARGVDGDLHLGQLELDRSARPAPQGKPLGDPGEPRERGPPARTGIGGSVLGWPFKQVGCLLVAQLGVAADHRLVKTSLENLALAREAELHGQHRPILSRPKRAESARETLGEHGDRTVREIETIAPSPGLGVDEAPRHHEMTDIGDRDPEPLAPAVGVGEERVVVVAGRSGIDRDERELAQIEASREFLGGKGVGDLVDLEASSAGECGGEAVFPGECMVVRIGIASGPQNLDDAYGELFRSPPADAARFALRLAIRSFALARHQNPVALPSALRLRRDELERRKLEAAEGNQAEDLAVATDGADPALARLVDHADEHPSALRARRASLEPDLRALLDGLPQAVDLPTHARLVLDLELLAVGAGPLDPDDTTLARPLRSSRRGLARRAPRGPFRPPRDPFSLDQTSPHRIVDFGFDASAPPPYPAARCPGGGIGRRAGLRIQCLKRRAGSTPVPGTILATPCVFSARLTLPAFVARQGRRG